MNMPIYLDYAATTPVDECVAEAMSQCLTKDGVFANPASRSHQFGWQAEQQVELARRNVADLLGCDPREVVWTSGATESNNLALKGVFEAAAQDGQYGGHLITSLAEHKAIIDPAKWLEAQGVDITWLAPNADGFITAQQLKEAFRPDTRLVSLMHINNETGAINPVAEFAAVCAEEGVLFHVDAAQSAGKISIENIGADLISLSAHKFYGPKGVGALFVKRVLQQGAVAPQIQGGGHERGMRSGTLATHQLVGMGEAAKIAKQQLPQDQANMKALRDQLWNGIADLPAIRRNGDLEHLSPGHLNVCFAGMDGEVLLLSMRELAVSSGSACTSASMEPSHVLKAMGLSDDDAHSSIRMSVGRYTQVDDIDQAIAHIRQIVNSLQAA
jgi:cysteine desulfurase